MPDRLIAQVRMRLKQVNQTKSEYLYFVANVEDGKVYFATIKEEHDQNVAEHINSKLPQQVVQTKIMWFST